MRERYQIWLSLHRDSRFTYSADTRKFYALAGVDAEAVWNEYTVDQGLEVEFFKWNPFLFETECEYLFGRVGGGGDDQSLSYSSVDQPPLTASSSVSSSLTYHHGSPREDGEDYAMPLVDGFPRFYRHHRRPQYTPASSSTDGVVSDMNSGGSRSHRRSFSSSAAAHYPSSPSTTTSSFIQHSLPNSPTSGMMMRIDPVRHRSASLAGDGSEIKGGIITTTSSSFTSARSFSSNVSLPSPQSISSYHSVPHQSSSSSSPLAMDFSSATISSSSLSSSSSSASLTHLASNSASSRSASSLSSPQISSLGRYRLAQILDETDTCDESSLAASTIVDVVSTTTAVTNSVGSLSSSLASAKTEEYDDYDDHYAEEEVAVNYESVFSSAASSALTDFAPRIKKYSSSLRLDTMSSIVKSLLEQVSAALVNTGDDDILGEVDSNGRNVISQTAASIPPPPPFMSSFIPTPTTGDADQLYVTSSGLPSYVPISPAAQPAVPSASGLTNMSMDTKAEIEPSAIKDVSKSESTNKKSITSLKRPWDARENNVDESMAAKFRNDQDSQDPMVNQQTSLYPTPLLKRVRIGLLDLQRELEAELN